MLINLESKKYRILRIAGPRSFINILGSWGILKGLSAFEEYQIYFIYLITYKIIVRFGKKLSAGNMSNLGQI
jgi:hypothetical protein